MIYGAGWLERWVRENETQRSPRVDSKGEVSLLGARANDSIITSAPYLTVSDPTDCQLVGLRCAVPRRDFAFESLRRVPSSANSLC